MSMKHVTALVPISFALAVLMAGCSEDKKEPADEAGTFERMGRKTDGAVDKSKEAAGDAWDKTKDVSGKAVDKTKEVSKKAWDKTKEKTGDAVDVTRDKVGESIENIGKAISGDEKE